MISVEDVLRSFISNSNPNSISIVEGNRGLFDGMDTKGTYSTSELAKLLKSPVIIVIDCTKSTRTVAAMVLGCCKFDPDLKIGGVVLNKVSNHRHEKMIRSSIEEYTGIKVLGTIPKMDDFMFLERHLGLLPPAEHHNCDLALNLAKDAIIKHVDINLIKEVAYSAEPLSSNLSKPVYKKMGHVKIGVVRDSAFNFYYPENLEQLQNYGAELIELNSMTDKELPSLNALYIGGGFPETHAEQLSSNKSFLNSLKQKIESGLPVYAECGGLTYLGESIFINGKTFPMVGIFPVKYEIASKPQGHGYTIMEVDKPNPYFEIGTEIRGHEFRYSNILECDIDKIKTVYKVKRGRGFDGSRDGLCYKNVLASFCHIHALGMKDWAKNFVEETLFNR
jgi:cobyrinic acid a,c-diamide synthase